MRAKHGIPLKRCTSGKSGTWVWAEGQGWGGRGHLWSRNLTARVPRATARPLPLARGHALPPNWGVSKNVRDLFSPHGSPAPTKVAGRWADMALVVPNSPALSLRLGWQVEGKNGF